MHRAGVYALIGGGVLTLLGLVTGFGFLFAGRDEQALLFLGLVPLGFVLGFAGVVATLLGSPGASD